MKPKRVQRRRTNGCRMPPGAIYVGRGSKWGNPFVVGRHGTVSQCVELFYQLALGHLCISVNSETVALQEAARKAMEDAPVELFGCDLACWCPLDQPCHADVLLEIANK